MLTDSYKHFVWNRDPHAMERMARNGLDRASVSRLHPQVKRDLEISLVLSLMYQRRLAEARGLTRSILETDPNDEELLWCEAQLAFMMNDQSPPPWKLLEARWGVQHTGERPVEFLRAWDGSPLAGRPVLFAGEGGLGDQIQFIRFAPRLKEVGAGRVALSANPRLLSLFRSMKGIDQFLSTPLDSNHPLGASEFDVVIPMMSAPGMLAVTSEALPRDVPYLKASDVDTEGARRRMGPRDSGKPAVGFCWQSARRLKVPPLELFAPLFSVPDIRPFGLGQQAAIEAACFEYGIGDLGDTNIMASAGAVAALDLVITVDSMMAHLAGSLGVPVWLLLNFVPNWRWPLEGETTPWYPTMRVFRREISGWESVMQRVASELADYSSRHQDGRRARAEVAPVRLFQDRTGD